tara:strand:+ start:490 stop:687 length:198 start_codon:yes stop_codon:yes gene_type:complete
VEDLEVVAERLEVAVEDLEVAVEDLEVAVTLLTVVLERHLATQVCHLRNGLVKVEVDNYITVLMM